MSLIKSYLHTKMMDNLEMLTAREQLMEDIGSIFDSFRFETYDDLYELEKNLCDAVCKNFPSESIEKKPID